MCELCKSCSCLHADCQQLLNFLSGWHYTQCSYFFTHPLYCKGDSRFRNPPIIIHEILNVIRVIFDKIEAKYPDQKKGIFLANDTYANMFLNLIFQKYGTFPSTYEIVGFDDSPIASEAILPITTVGQQIDVIAKTAMDLLVRQMDEQKKRAPKPLGEPIHKQITPILIRRNTTQ